MSLLKNGFVLTNDNKLYHKTDLTGWNIRESNTCDAHELWAVEKTTGVPVYVDWFGNMYEKSNVDKHPLIEKILDQDSE